MASPVRLLSTYFLLVKAKDVLQDLQNLVTSTTRSCTCKAFRSEILKPCQYGCGTTATEMASVSASGASRCPDRKEKSSELQCFACIIAGGRSSVRLRSMRQPIWLGQEVRTEDVTRFWINISRKFGWGTGRGTTADQQPVFKLTAQIS